MADGALPEGARAATGDEMVAEDQRGELGQDHAVSARMCSQVRHRDIFTAAESEKPKGEKQR